jgi:ABC-2 type transport system permease protein
VELDGIPLLAADMKIIRIFFHDFKISLLNELAHKVNFLMRFLADSIFFFVYFVFYTVVFTYVPDINGWGKYDILSVMGTFHIVVSLFFAFFMPNLAQIPELVKSGGLDGYIVKPVNSQFLLSTRSYDIGSLINIFLGIAIIISSVVQLGIEISLIRVLLYIGCIFIGVFIMYNLMFILLCTIFWLHDSSWGIGFFMTFNAFADRPLSIYKGIVYKFIVYVYPIGLVANVPANIVLNRPGYKLEIWFVAVAVLLFLLSKFIWAKGIKRYEGASI